MSLFFKYFFHICFPHICQTLVFLRSFVLKHVPSSSFALRQSPFGFPSYNSLSSAFLHTTVSLLLSLEKQSPFGFPSYNSLLSAFLHARVSLQLSIKQHLRYNKNHLP